ncbi:MAG: precorrin-6A synthase (deacetylating) [Solirubrobacteraceae bacterium]|nr:precorrin-6A synthase (deacetylating) [Solirubrobacteraceae bacterium]
MSRTMLVIGIGAGDPDYLTLQAIKAMNRADVVFVVVKTTDKQELVDLRHTILETHMQREHTLVPIQDPDRDRDPANYKQTVQEWRDERTRRWGAAIDEHLKDGQTGAFLVWGDPALYDSTLDVLADIELGDTSIEVIPGISSVQALAAGHGIALNRVGGAIEITPGRRYADGIPDGVDDAVVMLDTRNVYAKAPDDFDVYWGAYLGTEDEILISGPVREVEDEIARIRAQAREDKGWMFDTYLLRRRQP